MANGCRVLCYVASSSGLVVVVVVVNRPLPRDGGMAEDHGASEARTIINCTSQQPPQRGGAVPDPVWVRSK